MFITLKIFRKIERDGQSSMAAVNSSMNYREIIEYFYPTDTPFRQLLLLHSNQVREKALRILETSGMTLDRRVVVAGAMLHDIGIGMCHAPKILCVGQEPYIAHGVIGGRMLRQYGEKYRIDLEPLARICERHTGSGLTVEDIRRQNLPIPEHNFLPETPEEKLICLADKFFSKSGNQKEKSIDNIRQALGKFGNDSVERFDQMCCLFGITNATSKA